jgi:hypothetical protein
MNNKSNIKEWVFFSPDNQSINFDDEESKFIPPVNTCPANLKNSRIGSPANLKNSRIENKKKDPLNENEKKLSAEQHSIRANSVLRSLRSSIEKIKNSIDKSDSSLVKQNTIDYLLLLDLDQSCKRDVEEIAYHEAKLNGLEIQNEKLSYLNTIKNDLMLRIEKIRKMQALVNRSRIQGEEKKLLDNVDIHLERLQSLKALIKETLLDKQGSNKIPLKIREKNNPKYTKLPKNTYSIGKLVTNSSNFSYEEIIPGDHLHDGKKMSDNKFENSDSKKKVKMSSLLKKINNKIC